MKIAQSNVNLTSASRYYENNVVEMSTGVAMAGNFQESFQGNLEVQQKKASKQGLSYAAKNPDFSEEGTALGSENYNSLKPTRSAYLSQAEQSLEEEIMAIRTSLLEQILKYMQLIGGDHKSVSFKQTIADMSNLISSGRMLSVTTVRETHIEEEEVTFEGTGIALTEDGRSIDFGVSFSMSTRLALSAGISIAQPVNFLDPLVINVGNDVTSISDQSFYFDLDCDGKEEELSNLAGGSGFLSLDINGDGKINDGSELFGTKSGDGFKDLSAYDLDGNGWIDENDEVYDKLRVWMRNEDGTDTLLTLKEADVGAIYLRSAQTDYQLRDSSFGTCAKLRSSGVFLKESGGVGVVQQIDLATR
ncbi:hypothetical protein D6853_13920 [Butyrivibrio sp. X503]|uniref:hypothetical protein n=1 Tax=Butyrivibrio sp. X503 TaxID=2364878 RepID=UPI000EA84FBE|nr:hypothetical protein [Butyrivibrio sp. X503]RKM54321.1 hypothetical protein D6853_13920 [Butyrivibrio sp. X503]